MALLAKKKIFIFGLWLVCFLLPFAGFAADKHFGITANLQSNKAEEIQLVVQVSIPAGSKLYADQFQVEVPKPLKIIPLALPVPQNEKDNFSGEQTLVYGQPFRAVYLIENPPSVARLLRRTGLTNKVVNVTIRYQGCDKKTCFLPASEDFQLQLKSEPETRKEQTTGSGQTEEGQTNRLGSIRQNYQIVAVQSGYMDARSFLSFLDLSGERGAEISSIQKTWQVGKFWISVLLMILGGLALNLTPCVLPLIPVNLAIIGAGVRAASARRGFLLGMAYGLGIVLAYGVLGLVTVLTGAQFGSLNASLWFNLAVALVFLVLGLGLLDVFMIDFSKFQNRFQLKGQGMFFILFLGAVSALLAGACVAPVVIAVLLLAADLYAQGQTIGLLMPFLLGLGMALPWPFAGAGLSFLPKPGKWMLRINYIFAAVILLMAFYYGTIGVKLAYNKYGARPEITGGHDANNDGNWFTFSGGSLPETGEKPVLLYFWASWCKTCQAMSAVTFKDENVRQKMRSYFCVKFQAENPQDSAVKQVLHDFGVIGLPTFIIMKPLGKDGKNDI